jgi:dienelactone hydrolase
MPHKLLHTLRHHRSAVRIGAVLMATVAAVSFVGCASSNAQSQQQAWDSRSISRAQALATAVDMPSAESLDSVALQWTDSARQREVLARLYMPPPSAHSAQVPLVVFSHGIGGSREGYTYLGKYLAANGIAALHLQHVGSDRNLWFGNPLMMVLRLQNAAKEGEAIARAKDVSFALDRVLGDAQLASRIDPQRIAAAGHSYGANTSLLVSGARIQREDGVRDFRIKTAVIISAPPFYGEADPNKILGAIQIPTLHITATGDEIKIPGYYSSPSDRVAVYEATGAAQPGARKMLAVFKDGSHSMFTDRLGTGGEALNPQIKKATRELTLAYLRTVFDLPGGQELTRWPGQHAGLIARFDRQM